jgi:large-conductance mechanosensitive channel
MPYAIAVAIGGALLSLVASLVGRVLLALALGFVSYQGFDLLLTQFTTLFMQYSQALSSDTLKVLGLLKLGTCFNIALSALTIRATLGGLQSGTFKRLVHK